MNAIAWVEMDPLRSDDEEGALATLSAALALARDALAVTYPDEPDPLCPRLYAVDVVLHHIAGLDGALARYRAVLDGDSRLPTHAD